MDINELKVPDDFPPMRDWTVHTGDPNRKSGIKYLLENIVQCDVAIAILKKKFVSREEYESVLTRLSNLEKWTTIPNVNSKVHDDGTNSTNSA